MSKTNEGDYSEKLTQIIANNDIKSVTIVRMEVPAVEDLKMQLRRQFMILGNSFHGKKKYIFRESISYTR